MIPLFKDIKLVIKSLRKSRGPEKNDFWWDRADETDRKRTVRHLSDPDTPERRIIREVLIQENISSVLDAGCGPATELTGYRENISQIAYVGLDRSAYMIGVARSRFPSDRFLRGDISSLPFGSDTFDAVVLRHTLEHIKNYRNAVEEAARVARKVVLVNFFHRLLPLPRDLIIFHKEGYWENWYSKSGFRALISKLPIERYERNKTIGTANQTAEIYVLYKNSRK